MSATLELKLIIAYSGLELRVITEKNPDCPTFLDTPMGFKSCPYERAKEDIIQDGDNAVRQCGAK